MTGLLRRWRGEMLFFLILVAVFAFPSFKLAKFHRQEAPVALPDKVRFGDSLVVNTKSPDWLSEFRRNGTPLTEISPGKFFLGIGLYDSSTISISGVWQSRSLPIWVNWLNLLDSKDMHYFVHTIEVERPFRNTRVKLRLPSSVQKRIQRPDPHLIEYRKIRSKVFQRRDGRFLGCWQAPLESRVNSPFGKPRTLPSGRRYFHSGVDLRARTGVPLPSMQRGEIVFARHLAVPGNTALIYHGAGITSQYMHMSRLDVKEGQTVELGDLVGLSGSTGRVEGPHLHWEVHWQGRRLNPLQFIETMTQTCLPTENRTLSASF